MALNALSPWNKGLKLRAWHALRAHPARISSYLLLDVCGLCISERQCLLRGLAWHRLELRIAEGKAQQGDWEPINKEDSCNVRAWQQLEEGSKAVRQQEHPHRRQDGAKGDLHNRPIRIPQDSGDCAHQSRLAGT